MRAFSRRNLLLSTTALASAAVLAGCSGPGGGGGSGPVNLRFAWWGNTSRHEATQQILDAFSAAHPDITVSGEPGDFASHFDRLATQTAARDAPDVITLTGVYVPEYARRGALLDLNEVSDHFSFDGMDENAARNGLVEQTPYAVTTGVNAQSVIVNPSVFEAAGVELPDDSSWTWEEFAELATEISAKTPDGTYGSAMPGDHEALHVFARQRGEAYYDETGAAAITEATIADFYTLGLEMMRSGATPGAAELSERSGESAEEALMGNGRAAMLVTWSSGLSQWTDASGSELQLMLPPGESQLNGLWVQSSQLYAISSTSANPEAAAQLIDFLIKDPVAGAIVKTDRGVPAVEALREAIADELSEPALGEAAYIERLTALPLRDRGAGPTGASSVTEITERMTSEVLFARLTPEQAAQRWLAEYTQAIS